MLNKFLWDYLPPILLIGGLVFGGFKLVDIEKKGRAESAALKEMFLEVAQKSPDHRNLVDVYKGCLATPRKKMVTRDQHEDQCMVDLSEWSKGLTLKVPFSVIGKDILAGETKVYREYR